MRPLDELARLWNDTRLRMPRASWMRVPWPWPVAAAACGVLLTLAATSASQVPSESNADPVTVASVSSVDCQGQTWPYLSDDCLQRDHGAKGRPATPVRVIQPDPAMAQAAIGATEWTRRATSSANHTPPRDAPKSRRQKDQEPDRSRTVTIRSGRDRAAPRVYVVPSDSAYRAYGYAPR
jgi:hypothetical protein